MTTPLVVNAAGHSAPSLYTSLGLVAPTHPAPPRHYFARGNYFKLSSSGPPVVNGLVYPVPKPDLSGLGIHATVGVDGGVKFGPDVDWFKSSISEPLGDFYAVEDAEVEGLKAKVRVRESGFTRPRFPQPILPYVQNNLTTQCILHPRFACRCRYCCRCLFFVAVFRGCREVHTQPLRLWRAPVRLLRSASEAVAPQRSSRRRF